MTSETNVDVSSSAAFMDLQSLEKYRKYLNDAYNAVRRHIWTLHVVEGIKSKNQELFAEMQNLGGMQVTVPGGLSKIHSKVAQWVDVFSSEDEEPKKVGTVEPRVVKEVKRLSNMIFEKTMEACGHDVMSLQKLTSVTGSLKELMRVLEEEIRRGMEGLSGNSNPSGRGQNEEEVRVVMEMVSNYASLYMDYCAVEAHTCNYLKESLKAMNHGGYISYVVSGLIDSDCGVELLRQAAEGYVERVEGLVSVAGKVGVDSRRLIRELKKMKSIVKSCIDKEEEHKNQIREYIELLKACEGVQRQKDSLAIHEQVYGGPKSIRVSALSLVNPGGVVPHVRGEQTMSARVPRGSEWSGEEALRSRVREDSEEFLKAFKYDYNDIRKSRARDVRMKELNKYRNRLRFHLLDGRGKLIGDLGAWEYRLATVKTDGESKRAWNEKLQKMLGSGTLWGGAGHEVWQGSLAPGYEDYRAPKPRTDDRLWNTKTLLGQAGGVLEEGIQNSKGKPNEEEHEEHEADAKWKRLSANLDRMLDRLGNQALQLFQQRTIEDSGETMNAMVAVPYLNSELSPVELGTSGLGLGQGSRYLSEWGRRMAQMTRDIEELASVGLKEHTENLEALLEKARNKTSHSGEKLALARSLYADANNLPTAKIKGWENLVKKYEMNYEDEEKIGGSEISISLDNIAFTDGFDS
jgi:hypothetical protein